MKKGVCLCFVKAPELDKRMLSFFKHASGVIFTVQTEAPLSDQDIEKCQWLFDGAALLNENKLSDSYIGPRANMVSPWSTNAVEITQNMGISGISRIEQLQPYSEQSIYDPMLMQKYDAPGQECLDITINPEPVAEIHDIAAYNETEGLALSTDEIAYLESLSQRLGRKLTDSEVFGFSQVNSEHCRHKIFNGTFIIDGEEKDRSLFKMIKETSKQHPNHIVSAYKDNVAFISGPKIKQLTPEQPEKPSSYELSDAESVISLKAETHNFPTTVEPFNGAATGSGGEIRDRMAGGQGSIPLAGTAVYMTAYARNLNQKWEQNIKPREWLYQTPLDILIKASNGASDFGNKFGQPLINGSLFTFEHEEAGQVKGYDKVIMLAGGVGYGVLDQSKKKEPSPGDVIIVMGGDNYRIGMGGAAVSSANTGDYDSGIELNAVQRSNPEMQKRVANVVRAMVEKGSNPIISIHDHGAGGHLNCLSELVETTGGKIDLMALPIGDVTLSAKEIIGNESQERMGIIIKRDDLPFLKQICERERAPIYVVGEVTGDGMFSFVDDKLSQQPLDMALSDLFGSSPKTIMEDSSVMTDYYEPDTSDINIENRLKQVLQLEAVACKDWLTNKVDRCVGGRVAVQQCCGPLQLPLNNCGVMALDFESDFGIATALGHAPASALIDAAAGSRIAIAEALTNIIWVPLTYGLSGISLSANWMWPCRNPGEDARIYEAVEAVSQFAIDLGINVPTGKDSLSMKQSYPDRKVISPGTVIITAVGECLDINKVVTPVARLSGGSLYYIDMSQSPLALGGSSLYQSLNAVGNDNPDVTDAEYFKTVFNVIQNAIGQDLISAGHDISSGGLITTLLEMLFSTPGLGAEIDLSGINSDHCKALFSENNGIIVQADQGLCDLLNAQNISYHYLGEVDESGSLEIRHESGLNQFDVAAYRDLWYRPSFEFDKHQSGEVMAQERYQNYKNQPLTYSLPQQYTKTLQPTNRDEALKPIAAILREKGSNSEREMANALYQAGFEVRDVHMTDLMSGRETLEDVQFLGAVGGFSNSDVLGSAKGWAGAIKYNAKAKQAIDAFFARQDTMSIGICNGCQLFMELDLIYPEHSSGGKMTFNDSHKHESAFTSVVVNDGPSIMLKPLIGSRLGVWISHGEGKFTLPMSEENYHISAVYGYDTYPANPNGSDYNAAMVCSADGRHLATMPHIERSLYSWNWPYKGDSNQGKFSPWLLAFNAAYDWCKANK